MRHLRPLLLIFALLCAPAFAQVQGETAPPVFQSVQEEARFRALTHELRCVMCQNQSLADSNAQIAQDLRAQVLQQLRAGRSDGEIRDFMVERYGEFVLYKPVVSAHTWLLWFGPLLLMLAGAFVLWNLLRRQQRNAIQIPQDEPQEW